jgi:hypothetical protein
VIGKCAFGKQLQALGVLGADEVEYGTCLNSLPFFLSIADIAQTRTQSTCSLTCSGK